MIPNVGLSKSIPYIITMHNPTRAKSGGYFFHLSLSFIRSQYFDFHLGSRLA